MKLMRWLPGRSLPPGAVIQLGRFVWSSFWQVMMSQMAPSNRSGEYLRPVSQFRASVRAEADHPYPAASNRYQLIVGLGCPWAHRTLVTRALKGLDAAIAVTVVSPSPETGGWAFTAPMKGCSTLAELYQWVQPGYRGRATVPVLWDGETETIVNNESADIIVMLNAAFNGFASRPDWDLYPATLRPTVDAWNEKVYHAVNNGVYRCGFAQSQAAYDQAFGELFSTLDEIDRFLGDSRYLCGDLLTLADVRLFTTLFRFDAVYYGLFKCNQRRIQDYPHLGPYLRDVYQLPGVAATCDLEAVKRDYYGNLFPLNPGGIIPLGPDCAYLLAPHGRERLGDLGLPGQPR